MPSFYICILTHGALQEFPSHSAGLATNSVAFGSVRWRADHCARITDITM